MANDVWWIFKCLLAISISSFESSFFDWAFVILMFSFLSAFFYILEIDLLSDVYLTKTFIM